MASERTSIRRMRGIHRMRGLLSIGCLTVGGGLTAPAWADGGAGGASFNGLVPGALGGTGFVGNPGQAGTCSPGDFGPGGGGGGAGGGAGGTGGAGGSTCNRPGGAGGAGGNSLEPNGQDGARGPGSGAGGGGGGFNGNGAGSPTFTSSGPLTGGNGGAGGISDNDVSLGGGSGGGGAGGYGAVVTGAGQHTNSHVVKGGNGGDGGDFGFSTRGYAGNGGDGGVGLQFTVPGAVLTNSGTIEGGAGGRGGLVPDLGTQGIAGLGGAGIVGQGLRIINAGTIRGGFAGDFGSQANAITFTGGTNILELHSTSQIEGVVAVAGGTGTLRLGGTATDGTFDVRNIGVGRQYEGFTAFQKTGSGTWALTNGPPFFTTEVTPWTISEGTLGFTGNSDFGATSGRLTLDGGRLRVDAVNATIATRPMTITANGGTIDTNGNNLGINSVMEGPGGLTKDGAGTLRLFGANTYTGGTTINAGTLQLISSNRLAAAGALTINGGIFDLNNNNQTVAALSGAGGTIALGSGTLTTNGAANATLAAAITGTGGRFIKQGGGVLTFTGTNSYTGGTTVSGGTLMGNTSSLQGNILNDAAVVFAQNGDGAYGGAMTGTGSLTKTGTGTVMLTGTNTYGGGTTIGGGLINFAAAGNLGTGTIMLNGGGLQWATGNTTDISARLVALGVGGGTFDTNGNNVTLASNIGGAGGLTKAGAGTLILGGTNSYSGGTTVTGGILQGTTTSLQGNILNNANVTFDQPTGGTYAGAMSGTGSLTMSGGGTLILSGSNSYGGGTTVSGGVLQGSSTSLQGNILNNASVVFNQTASGTYSGAMSGTGGLTLQGGGLLAMTGASTYTGATTVNASTLVVDGSLASTVTLNNGGMLGGNGTIGALVSNGGTLAPGNSIGTLNINNNFTQNGGSYVVEANAQGQSDRVNVAGTATVNGSTVQVVAAAGSYGASTTYIILNATGGVSGTYSSVSSNFAFLTPSLSYNANNVFLTLALQGSTPFSGFGGNTNNQRSVGSALDQTWADASGDFATVIGALTGLSTTQASPALDAISGQQYADFGTTNVANASLFMNALGQQMASARGSVGTGQRQALAMACDVEACDATRPLSAWFSGLGGLGSVQGNGNSSTLTYNVGGAAAGIDYRLDPRFLVGVGVAYSHGTQWVNSFMGQGWTDSVSVAAYGSFTPMGQGTGFYADALAGYAYFNNQMQRQIQIPGLQPRTASGSTGANQFLTQVETGYTMPVFAPAALTATPFARLQFATTSQNAFTESGASSLNLSVAQQTTNSLRTVLGAELASSIGLANQRALDLAFRLGWQHEYADTGRPITAAFSGAPSASFTVYGATPTRDAAIVGVSAATTIAKATQIYLRYDGQLASGTDNHAFTAGLRMSW